MICKFCGFNNVDDAAFCSRCGSPLKENRPTPPASNSADPVVDNDKKTIRMATSPTESIAGDVMRHDCGYPLLPGTRVCPNCHKPVDGVTTTPPPPPSGDAKKTVVVNSPAQQGKDTVPKETDRFVTPEQNNSIPKVTEISAIPAQGYSNAKKTERFDPSDNQLGKVDKRTVNFRQMKQESRPHQVETAVPECSLKPIARNGEMAAPAKHNYQGEEVILNRQNTDPENSTITSRQQALLSFDNGKWYIEDKSAYKTTYIRVTKKTEIKEGDIIGLGDREFEFTTK